MHYSVDYGALDGHEKKGEALRDIVDYCGWPKFSEVSALLHKEKPTPRSWLMLAGLFGVTGYPATVWYDLIIGPGTDWQQIWKEMQ